MARRLDQIIVVDVECTCWEGDPPPGQQSEIIEIGVCAVDLDGARRIDKEAILVRPERSRVSDFCTRLTTLTQAQVEGGISLAAACQKLRQDYRTPERAWASYGDFDRCQFERQSALEGIPYPFGNTHVNVKHLLALALRLPREVGMDRALELLDLPLEGTHHRGVDDAWNIAAVLMVLMEKLRGRP